MDFLVIVLFLLGVSLAIYIAVRFSNWSEKFTQSTTTTTANPNSIPQHSHATIAAEQTMPALSRTGTEILTEYLSQRGCFV